MTVPRLRSWGFSSKKANSEACSSSLMIVLDLHGSWKEEVCLLVSFGLDGAESRDIVSGSLCLS